MRTAAPRTEPLTIQPHVYRARPGYLITGGVTSIFCRTLPGAKRIAVALFDGDVGLADRILSAESDPLFSVEDVEYRLALLGDRVRLCGTARAPAGRRRPA